MPKKKIFEDADAGGLGLFVARNYVSSIKISFFRRHYNNPDHWAEVISNARKSILTFGDLQYVKKYHPASARLIESFIIFTNLYPTNIGMERENLIFGNPRVRVNGNTLTADPAEIQGNGVTNVHDLSIRNLLVPNTVKTVMSKANIANNLNIRMSDNLYDKICNGTRRIRDKLSNENVSKSMVLVAQSKKKGSKQFRRAIENRIARKKNETKRKCSITRERQFNFIASPENELKLGTLWTTYTLDNSTRSFLFRLANNTYKTNSNIARFDHNRSENCTHCVNAGIITKETPAHLFVECPRTVEIFRRLSERTENKVFAPREFIANGNNENYPAKWERILYGIVMHCIFNNREKREQYVKIENDVIKKINATKANNFWFKTMLEQNFNWGAINCQSS